MKSAKIIFTVIVGALLLASGLGCPRNTHRIIPAENLTPAEWNYRAVWNSARDVMTDYYFRLDRQDLRAGEITTHPLTGKQWWEFWRKDAATNAELMENSLQTIYRIAMIKIRPVKGSENKYAATAEIQVFRSDMPIRDDSSFSEAMNMLAQTQDYAKNEVEGHPEHMLTDETGRARLQKQYLVSLGRDNALERKIASQINRSAVQSGLGRKRPTAATKPTATTKPATLMKLTPTTKPAAK